MGGSSAGVAWPVSDLTLLTVGHGTLSAEAFTTLLQSAGVDHLVDVRTVPASRRHPHVARDQLSSWLPAAGVGYRWEPRLGGFRRPTPHSPNVALRHPSFRGYADYMASDDFHAALDEVVAATEGTTALMCAETLWWRCHRRLIADGAELLCHRRVLHLGHDGRLADHRLTDGVRVQGTNLVYDAGQPPLMEFP